MLSKAYYAQIYAGIIGLGRLYSLKNFLGTLENHAQKFSPVNLSPFTVRTYLTVMSSIHIPQPQLAIYM